METTSNKPSSSPLIHDWRERLECRDRPTLSPTDFDVSDMLYRGFSSDDLDDEGKIDIDSIKLADLSCNWGRFSVPHDVRHRAGGRSDDGCYGFSVEVARYKAVATPVHVPLCHDDPENYAHVEVRTLRDKEDVLSAPLKGRKNSKTRKQKQLRAEWRTHLVNSIQQHGRIIEPGDQLD